MTRHLLLLFILSTALACNDVLEPEGCLPVDRATPLADNTLWVQLAEGEDPYVEDRPEVVECTSAGLTLEGQVLEVDTGKCNYLSAQQPLLASVSACDTVRAVITHEALFDVSPASAHISISMAGQRVYEAFIPIPSDNNILTPQWQLPQGAEKGSPIVFHLHNHGVNTWNLLSINAVPE